MQKNEEPIVIEQTYAASVEEVWNALTDHKEMVLWYFEVLPNFKPEVGFITQFLIENEGRKFTHQWKITEVSPHKKISYQWTFAEYPGRSITHFDLSEEGNATRLTLTAEVLEDYPTDVPEFKRESGVGGWNYFLGGQLKDYLEG